MADPAGVSEELLVDEDELEDDFEDGDEYEDEQELEETNAAQDDVEGADEGGPAAGGERQQARPQRRGGSPLGFLSVLRPSRLIKLIQDQGPRLQHLVWRLEDASVVTAKSAVKFALKAARPALLWFIVARAGRTIRRGRDLNIRTARQPLEEQQEYYLRHLLGADWQDQLKQDMLDSLAEVAAGYITDDMVDEKRKLAAVMLRQLEVDEWDKERMRHFYYGLYGLGPWYWDMEERLHNPFFVTARAWNSPPENWVNQNKTYDDSVPAANVDCREAALAAAEQAAGSRLSSSARQALKSREALSHLDGILTTELLSKLGDPVTLRDKVLPA